MPFWWFMKNKNKQYVIVENLTDDINKLEKRIDNVGKENLKKISIRNIKIFGRFMQLIGPYLLAFILPFGLQSLIYDIPIYQENVKQEKRYMMELDNQGVISYQSKYSKFENESNKLYIYGKWKMGDDSFYQRTIKTYSIREFSIDEIKELINKDDLEVSDILGEPLSEIVEHKNILTDEELNEESYIIAIKYYADSDDYIIIKQPLIDNIMYSLFYLASVFIIVFPIFRYRVDESNFDFTYCVEKLKEKYKKTDVKMLEKKLEIKKDSYQRLTGYKYEK